MRKFTSLGFTILEMLVVLGVGSILVVMGITGTKSFKSGQIVNGVAKEFLANARVVQTKMANGADGLVVMSVDVAASGTSYTITKYLATGTSVTTVNLPSGVTISQTADSTKVYFCFVNPYLTTLGTGAYQCGTCTAGAGYFCRGSTNSYSATTPVEITFTQTGGGYSKKVIFEGAGISVSRVYAN